MSIDKFELMAPNLPVAVIHVHDLLTRNGHLAMIVGGWVRDTLLGMVPRDIDIVTSASVSVVNSLFPYSRSIGGRFPHTVVQVEKFFIEVSQFYNIERDSSIKGDVPSTQNIGSDDQLLEKIMERDYLSRDFTVNGIYYCLASRSIYGCGTSIRDLKSYQLRFIAPSLNYIGHPLAMLRAIRLSQSLHFSIDQDVRNHIQSHGHTISSLSPEAIYLELFKQFNSGYSRNCLQIICDLSLNDHLCPIFSQVHDEGENSFVSASLKFIDSSCIKGEKFSLQFFFSILLWPFVKDHLISIWSLPLDKFFNEIAHILKDVLKKNFILNRFLHECVQIWHSQLQFDKSAVSCGSTLPLVVPISVFLNFGALRERSKEVEPGTYDCLVNFLHKAS